MNTGVTLLLAALFSTAAVAHEHPRGATFRAEYTARQRTACRPGGLVEAITMPCGIRIPDGSIVGWLNHHLEGI